MDSILGLIIGFAIGVVVVGLAIEMGMKKTSQSQPSSKHAKSWSISEISNPRIMAEYLGDDIELPNDAKVIVNRYKNEQKFAGLDVRKNSDIKGNYIIRQNLRGMSFTAP